MLSPARLQKLEEIHRRHLEGLPNRAIEEEMVVDLLTTLRDMALRNEVLRLENEHIRRRLGPERSAKEK